MGNGTIFTFLYFLFFKIEVGVSLLEIQTNVVDLIFYLQLQITKRDILEHDDTQVCADSIQYVSPK